MDGLFDQITGLPVHPLAVHAAVALLPLTALSLLVAAFSPWWRRRLGTASLVLFTVAVAATFLAKESGEALAGHLGTPVEHAEWADRLFAVSALTWVSALAWWFLGRRHETRTRHDAPVSTATSAGGTTGTTGAAGAAGATAVTGSAGSHDGRDGHDGHDGRRADGLGRILGPLTAALALATTVLTVVVGHSGADATWRGALDGTGTGQETRAFSPEQVARHADATSCWTISEGTVYDLTPWLAGHPADQPVLTPHCGKDAGDALGTRRDGLAPYRLGTIGHGEGGEH